MKCKHCGKELLHNMGIYEYHGDVYCEYCMYPVEKYELDGREIVDSDNVTSYSDVHQMIRRVEQRLNSKLMEYFEINIRGERSEELESEIKELENLRKMLTD